MVSGQATMLGRGCSRKDNKSDSRSLCHWSNLRKILGFAVCRPCVAKEEGTVVSGSIQHGAVEEPTCQLQLRGHSYGTYLLGRGLSKLSGMQFNRVFLDGSVLPAQWIWMNYGRQVAGLRNSRARLDFPCRHIVQRSSRNRHERYRNRRLHRIQIPFDLTRSDAFIMEGTEQRWRNRLAPIFLNFS